MSQIVDNLIAFKIMSMMVKPFIETDAYKLGIIDAHGKTIRKANTLTTSAEKNAYNYLTRLIFTMKKIINKLPGGESRLKSMVAALWLVKEHYESGSRSTAMMQEKFDNLMKMMDNRVSLVEEEILVRKFLDEDGMGAGAVGGAPTNNTSGPVATQEPKIGPKDIKKYKAGQGGTIAGMTRRPTPVVSK